MSKSKLDDILHSLHFDEHDELASSVEKALDGCEIVIAENKQQIKDLMLDVFKSCEHDGSFVSVSAFEKKVQEL